MFFVLKINVKVKRLIFPRQIQFIHSPQGGELLIDNENPFRDFHMGPCAGFTSLTFGGLPQVVEAVIWQVSSSTPALAAHT